MSMETRGRPARSGPAGSQTETSCVPPPDRWPTTDCGTARGGTSGSVAGGHVFQKAGLPGPVQNLIGEENETAVIVREVDAVRRAVAGTKEFYWGAAARQHLPGHGFDSEDVWPSERTDSAGDAAGVDRERRPVPAPGRSTV